MTTERSGMSLEQVRDSIREESKFQRTTKHHVTCTLMDIWANAIDAHLSRDAVVSAVSFSTVSAVVMALSRVGHAAPESQEEQAARFESLVMDLCRGVEGHYDRSTAVVSEADAIGLIDGLNMMANSSDSTGHNSEAEFLRCCAHVIHQSFASRHAPVPDGYVLVPVEPTDAMINAGACQISMRDGDEQGAAACWERMIANAPEAMLAQRDGGK